jgi:ubiquinone/menaquinone biosynthesis C-methylase UbiE
MFQGRHSRIYDFLARRLLRGAYRRFAEDIADAAPQGGAVLDAGTGPGVLLVELARLRPDLRLAGVDLSADMVAAATRNLAELGERASVHTGDVTHLPFPDGSFDIIVSSFSLHHWDDPQAAGPELARVLRTGGRLCVYDFRVAPFDELAAAFPGTPRRTLVRTGIPLFPRVVRFVVPVEAA